MVLVNYGFFSEPLSDMARTVGGLVSIYIMKTTAILVTLTEISDHLLFSKQSFLLKDRLPLTSQPHLFNPIVSPKINFKSCLCSQEVRSCPES